MNVVETTTEEGVRTITINRPNAHNSLNAELRLALLTLSSLQLPLVMIQIITSGCAQYRCAQKAGPSALAKT